MLLNRRNITSSVNHVPHFTLSAPGHVLNEQFNRLCPVEPFSVSAVLTKSLMNDRLRVHHISKGAQNSQLYRAASLQRAKPGVDIFSPADLNQVSRWRAYSVNVDLWAVPIANQLALFEALLQVLFAKARPALYRVGASLMFANIRNRNRSSFNEKRKILYFAQKATLSSAGISYYVVSLIIS